MTTLFRLTKYQKINGQVDNEDSREDKPGSMLVDKGSMNMRENWCVV